MKNLILGIAGTSLVCLSIKKAYDKGKKDGIDLCSLLLKNAHETQKIVESKYKKDEEK